MKLPTLLLLLAAVAIFPSCENPADTTTSAKVAPAVETALKLPADGGTTYVLTEDSKIRFIGSKVTGSHLGGFKSFRGKFTLKDGEPVGDANQVVIEMDTVFSDDEKLTTHLMSADFFDVAKHPQATFELTGIETESETRRIVSGNFTLCGTTKNLSFPATVTRTDGTLKLAAKFDINRRDFGMIFNGKPDNLIRDEVVIDLSLTAKPQS